MLKEIKKYSEDIQAFLRMSFKERSNAHLFILVIFSTCSLALSHMYTLACICTKKALERSAFSNQTRPQQMDSYSNEHKQSNQINFSNMELNYVYE